MSFSRFFGLLVLVPLQFVLFAGCSEGSSLSASPSLSDAISNIPDLYVDRDDYDYVIMVHHVENARTAEGEIPEGLRENTLASPSWVAEDLGVDFDFEPQTELSVMVRAVISTHFTLLLGEYDLDTIEQSLIDAGFSEDEYGDYTYWETDDHGFVLSAIDGGLIVGYQDDVEEYLAVRSGRARSLAEKDPDFFTMFDTILGQPGIFQGQIYLSDLDPETGSGVGNGRLVTWNDGSLNMGTFHFVPSEDDAPRAVERQRAELESNIEGTAMSIDVSADGRLIQAFMQDVDPATVR